MKKKKKGRVLLLISLIIGLMYACYAVSYFGGLITNSTSDSDVLASGVATALVINSTSWVENFKYLIVLRRRVISIKL